MPTEAYGELGVGNIEWIDDQFVEIDLADSNKRCRSIFNTANGTFVEKLCKTSPHNSNPHVQDRWGVWYTWWNLNNSVAGRASLQLISLTYASAGSGVTPISKILYEAKFHDSRVATPYPESTSRLAYDTDTDILFYSIVYDPEGSPLFNIPRLVWLNITAAGVTAISYVDFSAGLYDLSKSVLTDNGKHFVVANINATYGRTAYYVIPMKNIVAYGDNLNGTVIDLRTIETTHPELGTVIVPITFDTYVGLVSCILYAY
jgi:hypothetical protein